MKAVFFLPAPRSWAAVGTDRHTFWQRSKKLCLIRQEKSETNSDSCVLAHSYHILCLCFVMSLGQIIVFKDLTCDCETLLMCHS